VYPDSAYASGRGSFLRPVPQPVSGPSDSPTQSVAINCDWLPYIRGALQQLLLQATWQPGLPGLDITQGRAFNLIDLFQECSSPEPPFICTYAFALSSDGSPWTPRPEGPLIPPLSHFQPGVGWESVSALNPGGPLNWQIVSIGYALPSAGSVNIVEVGYTGLALGGGSPAQFAGDCCAIQLFLSGSLVSIYCVGANDLIGPDGILTYDFGGVAADDIWVSMVVGFDFPSPAAGYVALSGLAISGHATTSPC
jgi:hypothetical protein